MLQNALALNKNRLEQTSGETVLSFVKLGGSLKYVILKSGPLPRSLGTAGLERWRF